MRALRLGLAVVLWPVIGGCSGGNKLVGTWEAEGLGPGGLKGTIVTFNANNTYSSKNSLSGRSVSMSGTYSLEGNKLTVTVSKISGLSAKMQKLNEDRLAKAPSSDTSTLEWKNDKEVVIVSSTGRSVLRKRL